MSGPGLIELCIIKIQELIDNDNRKHLAGLWKDLKLMLVI